MSKTTKRAALALLLLCFVLGGTALYRLRTGSSQQTGQAAAGQPSAPIAPAVVPSPAAVVAEPVAPSEDPPRPTVAHPGRSAVVPSSAPAVAEPVAEPVAPPEDRPGPAVAQPAGRDEGGPARRQSGEEGRSHHRKPLAYAAPAGAASKADEEATAIAKEMSLLQKKWGNVTVELRPKLGAVEDFEIVRVAISVDGREVTALDGKTLGQHKSAVEAWNGTLETGAHILKVMVEYQGNGHHVFSYFNDYRYTAGSRTLFRVNEGAQVQLLVDLVDKGGVNTAFDKRLAIAFASEP